MAEVVVDLEKKTSRITLKSFSNVKNLEKKIYYESQLGLSLKKRNRLFEIIEKDNSWSNRQEGLYFTNVHAHHTQWHLHKENVEFKELANMIENRLMYSVLKVPLKHTVKECWGSIYGKDAIQLYKMVKRLQGFQIMLKRFFPLMIYFYYSQQTLTTLFQKV